MTTTDRPDRVRYDGPGSAETMDDWCRNSALLPRFQAAKTVLGTKHAARVLVEPEEGDLTQSAEWLIIEPGDSIYRLKPRDGDSPLRIAKATPAQQAASAFTQEDST
jgi:hypothetical protein